MCSGSVAAVPFNNRQVGHFHYLLTVAHHAYPLATFIIISPISPLLEVVVVNLINASFCVCVCVCQECSGVQTTSHCLLCPGKLQLMSTAAVAAAAAAATADSVSF